MTDAAFDDGQDRPLRLVALAPDDLPVISALCQDAVLEAGDIRWERGARRLAILLNRFRWEDAEAARAAGRPYERVRALLIARDVTRVARQGLPTGGDAVLSLLALDWQAGAAPAGRLVLTFAGDGALAVEADCLDLALHDVTRPYAAPSGRAPDHG